MPINIRRLRKWMLLSMMALVLVVSAYYARGYYTRYLISKAIQKNAQKLGVDIQQSTDNFSFSKSEGGHTLFTIRASKAVQVKSGRAELHEVNIVVYGKGTNRFDQIYGSDFEYNPSTGEVSAKGEVHIDLQGVAEGNDRPDQAPPKELKNPIHLKTSGLVFNRNTGLAQTNERIEFRIPQANGSAIGATYDSKAQQLTLHSQIDLQATGQTPAHLTATRGVFTNGEPRVDFTNARLTRENGDITADQLAIHMRPDNTISQVTATGNVNAETKGPNGSQVRASRGDVYLDAKNHLQNAQLSGGVKVDSRGDQPMHGTAGKVLLTFGNGNRLDKVRAVENVKLVQDPPENKPQAQSVTLTSQSVDLNLKASGTRRAETNGPAQITVENAASATPNSSSKTVATAERFIANFDRRGRLTNLVGSPNAKVVSATPGQADKVASSNVLTLTMNSNGALGNIVQEGNFRYTENPPQAGKPSTEATAERATYDPQTETFALSGSPRVSDAGVTTTADRMRINRRTGDAVAEGSVKTTYSQLQPQPGGALLATSDPIHVTAATMTARRTNDTARYSGGARLWQGANIVEAPGIEFNRETRTVSAQGNSGKRVSTVFVQQGENRKQTPVNVMGMRLTYADAQRQAKFEGGVIMRSADGTLTANRLTVFLQPRGEGTNNTENAASELDKVVAEGNVVIQQDARRAIGNRLVYTAKNGSFQLTGGPPSIFDAEHGKVTGDSLTFFSRDDRVLVEGGNSAPSVTKARVIK